MTGKSKITELQARQIFTLRSSGWTLSAIGDEFGMTASGISHILSGKRWKRLKLTEPKVSREDVGSTKLKAKEVRRILALHQEGQTIRKIAEQFSVCPAAVYSIVTRKTWKHIPLEKKEIS